MTVCSWTRTAGAALIVLVAAACGDGETTDNRGYTKAPLENPSVLITAERPGDMSRYGSPNRVAAEVLTMAEEAPPAETSGEPLATVDLPEGVTQEMVTSGQTLFGGAGMCFACHGVNGAGGPLAPVLTDNTWLHIEGSYDELIQIITAGVPSPIQYAAAMPPRGGAPLTDEQVREVAAYVYSISR